MYMAALIWFTPLPRTRGNTWIASSATAIPAMAGASTTRGNDGDNDGPSNVIFVHSMASLEHTTGRQEKTPMSTASIRKNLSSRSVKTACIHDSHRARKRCGSAGESMAAGAATSGAVVTGTAGASLTGSPLTGCGPAAIARDL